MLSHGFECKGSTCSRICALGCLVVWSAFDLSALPRSRDLPAFSTGAGAESRRGLSPLFTFLHECCLLTVLDTTLSALLCAFANNFLPLVTGGTLYFEEYWGRLGYFTTVLGLLGGGELLFVCGHSSCQGSLLSITGGPCVCSPVSSCLCSLHSKHCVPTMVGAQSVLQRDISKVAFK